jgi:hypothetical protein
VWWAACGRIDLDVRARAFWMSAFGEPVTADGLVDMHPLRRLERPPPSEEARRVEDAMGWRLMGAALSQMNRDRGK